MENSVFRSLEIIENRILEKLTVERIADSVHFSKYHYQRLFREIVGESVMGYVTKRKLTLAGKMLLETEKLILEIALEFGFDSHEGFTRSFKSYMGVTPTNYRKYHLTGISQKNVKGKKAMLYSKTTNEIIKELNDFIVTVKETAIAARKVDTPEYAPFFALIADKTDGIADKVTGVLARITSIAENPDEITSRFAIIRIIEDNAFNTNLMALNVALAVHRGRAQPLDAHNLLCERYYQLANIAQFKASKAAEFFNELSALIFDDIRKATTEKIKTVVQKGKTAADTISGHENIKYEIENLVHRIEAASLNEATVLEYDDFLIQLNTITFAFEIDLVINSKNKNEMLDAMESFQESLSEAIEFLRSITKPEANPVLERSLKRKLCDLAYQGNILLFYTRSEIEKSGQSKAVFNEICDKANTFIQTANQATGPSDISDAAKNLKKISATMEEQGGAFKILAIEFKNLASRALQFTQ